MSASLVLLALGVGAVAGVAIVLLIIWVLRQHQVDEERTSGDLPRGVSLLVSKLDGAVFIVDKSLNVLDWGPVFHVPGAVFVNLQYGSAEAELAAAAALDGPAAQAASAVMVHGPAFLIPALHAQGLSLARAGAVAAAPTIGVMLTLVAWGFVTDRRGERFVLLAGLAGTTLAGLAAVFLAERDAARDDADRLRRRVAILEHTRYRLRARYHGALKLANARAIQRDDAVREVDRLLAAARDSVSAATTPPAVPSFEATTASTPLFVSVRICSMFF